MAIIRVDWRKVTSYCADIQSVLDGFTFDIDGDSFVMYYNTDNYRFAVYYELAGDGMLISLAQDFANLMSMDNTTDGFFCKVEELFRQHAVDFGFPLRHPKKPVMTWRDVKRKLDALTDEELDMDALVWTPQDFEWCNELTPIAKLDPSTDPDCGISEHNPLSFTLAETY